MPKARECASSSLLATELGLYYYYKDFVQSGHGIGNPCQVTGCTTTMEVETPPCQCGGLSAPAYPELWVTSLGISAHSNHGLRSLACQALRDDVACCHWGRESTCIRINLRDLFCFRTSAFSRGNPKPFSGVQKNLLCNSRSSNTLLRDYLFHNTVAYALLVHHTIWAPP